MILPFDKSGRYWYGLTAETLRGMGVMHILVVDDDEDVLTVLVEILRAAGFAVTAAGGGAAMREILAADHREIDAVVLDCQMPGEPSTDLALHAKNLRLPVVMISGHVASMQFADENGLQMLRKPFRSSELLAAIRQAIDSGEFGQRDV